MKPEKYLFEIILKKIHFFAPQVMQLSDKSCELAEENDRLFDKNKEQRRRIELLETEQSELVKQNSIQHLILEGMVR
jgi:hypothetical protein